MYIRIKITWPTPTPLRGVGPATYYNTPQGADNKYFCWAPMGPSPSAMSYSFYITEAIKSIHRHNTFGPHWGAVGAGDGGIGKLVATYIT